MTEQQNHLVQLVEQRKNVSIEIETLNGKTQRNKELLLKTQGAIDYLVAVGVTLPEAEAPAPEAEAPAPEAEAPAPEAEVPAPEAEVPAPEAEVPAPEAEVPVV